MRTVLRAATARLVVGQIDTDEAQSLLDVVEPRGKPAIFVLAEPEDMAVPALVAAGPSAHEPDVLRLGKLVVETVANTYVGSSRSEPCDAIVDGLRMAHRHLGPAGLDLVKPGGCGVGFCAGAVSGQTIQLVVVPPAQAFILHQGIVHSVPEASELGRGIWVRGDLRAEMFSGVGGVRDPEIRIYDAPIASGDTIVLLSSELARMLSEEDVQRAVAYEEAAAAADHLRGLALQRGVEAGLAIVVEVAASREETDDAAIEDRPEAERRTGLSFLNGNSPFPALSSNAELQGLGSLLASARHRVLGIVERLQPASHGEPAEEQDDEEDSGVIPWPRRTRQPGAQPHAEPAIHAGPVLEDRREEAAPDRDDEPPGVEPEVLRPQQAFDGLEEVAPRRTPELASTGPSVLQQAGRIGSRIGGSAVRALSAGRAAAARARTSKVRRAAARAYATPSIRMPSRGALVRQARHQLGQTRSSLRLPAAGQRRNLVLPAALAVLVLIILLIAVRTVKDQQQKQLNQRFDSLVASAQQLEGQAKSNADHAQAATQIRQAQALLDQAGTLRHDQTAVAAVRKALATDLDRMSNIYDLPAPTPVATVAAGGKAQTSGTAEVAGDATAVYVLDRGQQKVFQVMRVQKTSTAIAGKGDQAGQAQMGAPSMLASVEGGSLFVLDTDRHLWQYTPGKPGLAAVTLKGAEGWKGVQDIASYGGNLYVLDAATGNIFRYVPKDGQYPNPPSRFFDTDNKVPLSSGISMAIDGSIWVLGSDGQILKLAGGQGQAITPAGLPQPLSKPVSIYTTVDTHSLYILDGGGTRVVQLGKDGSYQRQLNLGLSAPASSIYVDEGSRALYAISNGTLYTYQLPL